MRSWVIAICLVCLPFTAAAAGSGYAVQVANDTRSAILAFDVAPAGSSNWVHVDFTHRPFEYMDGMIITLHDGDGCLRDFRTILSDGRRIVAHGFDLCRLHTYRPGRTFYDGHQGGIRLPYW